MASLCDGMATRASSILLAIVCVCIMFLSLLSTSFVLKLTVTLVKALVHFLLFLHVGHYSELLVFAQDFSISCVISVVGVKSKSVGFSLLDCIDNVLSFFVFALLCMSHILSFLLAILYALCV